MDIEGLPSPIESDRKEIIKAPVLNNDKNTHTQPPNPILPSLPMHSSSADEGVEAECDFEEVKIEDTSEERDLNLEFNM